MLTRLFILLSCLIFSYFSIRPVWPSESISNRLSNGLEDELETLLEETRDLQEKNENQVERSKWDGFRAKVGDDSLYSQILSNYAKQSLREGQTEVGDLLSGLSQVAIAQDGTLRSEVKSLSQSLFETMESQDLANGRDTQALQWVDFLTSTEHPSGLKELYGKLEESSRPEDLVLALDSIGTQIMKMMEREGGVEAIKRLPYRTEILEFYERILNDVRKKKIPLEEGVLEDLQSTHEILRDSIKPQNKPGDFSSSKKDIVGLESKVAFAENSQSKVILPIEHSNESLDASNDLRKSNRGFSNWLWLLPILLLALLFNRSKIYRQS